MSSLTQRYESPPPRGVIQTVTSIVPRRLVFPAPITTATAPPKARAVRLDFSTSISELPGQALATRADLESTSFGLGSGSTIPSEELLYDGDDHQDDDRLAGVTKERQSSSSDSVSTLSFAMTTFFSQDLLYLDYAASSQERKRKRKHSQSD